MYELAAQLPVYRDAVGTIAREMTTKLGHAPQPEVIVQKLLRDILGGFRPPVPSSCPKAWKRLMESAWADDPDERPTFQEMVGDFELWISKPAVYLQLAGNNARVGMRATGPGAITSRPTSLAGSAPNSP